jgi:hypothetical protein
MSLIGLPWPPRHGIELQPKLRLCHQLGNLCHPGWTRHLMPSGDWKPFVMCGYGLDGEAPLRWVFVDAQFMLYLRVPHAVRVRACRD